MQTTGIYFSSSIEGGKSSVTLNFDALQVRISATNFAETWSLQDVDLEIGGASDHLLFFTRRTLPTERFYVQLDKSLVQFLLNYSIPTWRPILRRARRRTMMSGQALAWGAVGLVILSIMAVVASRAAISRAVVQAIPYSAEQAIGEQLVKVAIPGSTTVRDESLESALRDLLKPLIEGMPTPFQDISLHISTSNDLNAFALPGGHLVFNLGMLRQATYSGEIVGVAAHELAHVTERHVVRNLLQGAGLFVVIQTIVGDITGLLALLMDQSSFILNQSFSREMETEADQVGMQYLVKAGIDPRGMADFFTKLVEQREKLGALPGKLEKHLEFLSTHPDVEKRITNIQAYYSKLDPALQAKLVRETPGYDKLKAALAKYP